MAMGIACSFILGDESKKCIRKQLRTYFANLMQNCVKYFRVEARLSRMIGTFCLM